MSDLVGTQIVGFLMHRLILYGEAVTYSIDFLKNGKIRLQSDLQ